MQTNDALTYEVKTIRVINATAAGVTNINGAVVDMAGYDAVRFVALLGTLTAGQQTSLKAQQGDQANLSDAADITGSATANALDGDSNRALITDVIQPRKRYVRCVVVRGTANAVVDGVIAELYKARVAPIAADPSVSQQKVLVPTA